MAWWALYKWYSLWNTVPKTNMISWYRSAINGETYSGDTSKFTDSMNKLRSLVRELYVSCEE